MNEIVLKENDVRYLPAQIDFPGYAECMAQAEEIAQYIDNIELTEDNIKEAKKVLADARKVTDGLTRRRIDIKKEIDAGYKSFEAQIKAVIDVIANADRSLRGKVTAMEEAERERKKAEILDLWNKRVIHYTINTYLPEAWKMWLTPHHLNKSMSMKNVEKDMVEWLEDTEAAFNSLGGMDDEYTVEYINTLDLAAAIRNVNARNAVKEQIRQADEEESATFIIYGEKNIKLTKLLLKDNGIKFEIR